MDKVTEDKSTKDKVTEDKSTKDKVTEDKSTKDKVHRPNPVGDRITGRWYTIYWQWGRNQIPEPTGYTTN